MSEDNNVVRNPELFSGGLVNTEFRTPFELSNGVFCSDRNSTTIPYQTYSPYKSDVTNLTDFINQKLVGCDSVVKQIDKPIYKYAEDIQGNKYLLFKDLDGLTITEKNNALGVLYIVDVDGNVFEDLFGNLPIDETTTIKDVRVFYDKVLVVTADKIWLGNANTRNFFAVDYDGFFQTYYNNQNVYIGYNVGGEFSLTKFNGEDLITISNTSQIGDITSLFFYVKHNRVEFVYTDSAGDQLLTFVEYDLINDTWSGFTTIDFPYEILGYHDDDVTWHIYYEGLTMPNNVGGICFKFLQNTTTTSTDDCPQKDALEYTYDEVSGIQLT